MNKSNRVKWGTVAENIEEKILDSIRKGMSSGEDISIRPLREVFQNCDDESADRFYIRIDDDALYYVNDGNRLTVEFNQESEPIAGTCRMITGVSMASKKRDRNKAGNFGTGLRSAHAISHFIEVHGSTTNFIEIDELDEFGDKKAVIWKENPDGHYFGISNAYNKTLNEEGESIEFSVREDKERPKRTRLNTILPRDGILIRLPWRKEIYPGSVDKSEWEELSWNDKKIQKVGDLYIQEIPKVLLGCSWLREVVLDINVGKNKSRYAWIRDFNHREFEEKDSTNSVNLFSFKGEIDALHTGLIVDIKKNLELLNTKEYQLFSTLNRTISEDAEKAQLLPFCHILLPKVPKENLPAYTPIALAGDSGNKFGPIAYLPPDDSRTKIKIDGVKKHKQLWGALAINSFTEVLLPQVFHYTLEAFEKKINTILDLLPKQSPEKWFSEGRKMSYPSLQGISNQDEYLLNERIEESWEQLDISWGDYKEKIANALIFRNQNGELIPTNEIIKIELQENDKSEILEEIFQALGGTVVSSSQRKILSSMNEEDWGEHNLLKQMYTISEANHLKIKLIEFSEKLNLDSLDTELVRKLIDLIHVNPPLAWVEDTNLKRIPCIPAADGSLRPLMDENENDIFFLDSEIFPDLLPSNRRINQDFKNLASKFNFNNPRPEHLAVLIDQAAESKPDIFNNLAKYKKIHKQVSKALAIIISSNPTQEMRNLKFIPCLHKGKIITRGMSKIGAHVWPIDTFKSNRNNFFRREMILGDTTEKRTELDLHAKVYSNLIWLELHPDVEIEREKICDKLCIHLAVSDESGVNIIRSLIFAQTLPGLDLKTSRSVFDKDGDDWGLDEWLGEKLSNNLRDNILESLLKILASAAKRKNHGGMVTGWGADSREKVHKLHLLKNKDGKWSTLSELCYDLDPDLSVLFKKTAVYQSHKDILGIKVITNEVGKSGGSGLGVTHRINENDITEMINSLDGQSLEVRSKIIDMMLQSETEWEIEELDKLPWTPRLDGEFEIFKNCIIPTIEMKNLFGDNHPWYLKTKCNCDDPIVKNRARDLGLMQDHNNTVDIHRALVTPLLIWPGMFGNNIIEELRKSYYRTPEMQLGPERKSRLPDSTTTEWKEDSWLVDESIVDDLRKIFSVHNIIGSNELGITPKSLEMVKNWILPKDNGPDIEVLIDKFREYSNGKERKLSTVISYWNIFKFFERKDFPKNDDYRNLLFPVGEDVFTLAEIIIINEDQQEWFINEQFSEIQSIYELNSFSTILKEKFDVIDLSDGTTRDELRRQIKVMDNSNFSDLNIQRYWLILANIGNHDWLFTEDNWLYLTTLGFSFCNIGLDSRTYPKALIPEKTDSLEEIERMARQKLPLLWIPRGGDIMEKIYNILNENQPYNFLDRKSRALPKGTEQNLSRSKWPALTSSMNNVLKALNILHENGSISLESPGFKIDKVYQTREAIKSKLMVSLSQGSADVYWKDSYISKSILTQVDYKNKLITFTININEIDLEDSHLVEELRHFLGAPAEETRKLVKNQEHMWAGINSELGQEDWKNQRTESGMLHPARRATVSSDLSDIYGQCQICGQITPSNRQGDVQESVVSLFRESGGRYFSKDIKEHPGNYLYLCPNHFYLYRRSRGQNLLWLPQLDDVVKKIKKNSSNDFVNEMVNSVLSSRGEINLKVMTFEKIKGDGNEHATEREWPEGITWCGSHATQFKDALTQYLANLNR